MLNEHWIPAFAGMTPNGLNYKISQSHSREGGNPENKFLNRNLGFQIVTKDFCFYEEEKYIKLLAATAAESFADVFQLRNKMFSANELYRSALFVRSELSKADKGVSPLFIVNDRADIAFMSGADGVHLGQDDFPAAYAKKLFPGLIVGVSAENAEQAVRAEMNGADYIGAGPAYCTESKTDAGPPMGREEMIRICGAVNIPVIAIGGINQFNIKELAGCGLSGVAVISAVSGAKNPLETALKFKENIDKYFKTK
jgi:thiamine-phosphate pyrophosphorylase